MIAAFLKLSEKEAVYSDLRNNLHDSIVPCLQYG